MNSKILVVDDEPDIRTLLKDILEDEGYAVDVAEHAQQANETKARFSPDLVLLDIWMPDTDGVTLLKQWNERHELDCPVVMMSGHGTVETAVEATRYGAFDFVEKPLSMAKLLRTVRSALDSGVTDGPTPADEPLEQPVGNSQRMQQLRQLIQTRARDLAPVFLVGKPGSGVGIWANYLFSQQSMQVPRQGFQADTHRYQQGVFHNIYIPEVAELSMQSQRILLSLLQQPLLPASTGRFVVASQHDHAALREMPEVLPELAGFWRDAILVPTLDERIEDIPELLEYYANWFSDREGLPYRHFGVAAQNLIRNHPWRDGLNGLKGFVRRVLAHSDRDNVELAEITQLLQGQTRPADLAGDNLALSIDLNMDMRQAREHFEREYLKKQLELCRYNVSELARKIGQERTNLYRKLKVLGLHPKK